MSCLEDYRKVVGDGVVSEITRAARRLYGKRILHINSTYYGGGVAEMLYSLVPLLNDVGIEADWRILRGTPEFFTITKKFHNAIQGGPVNLTEMKKLLYVQNNQDFALYCKIGADCVVIHDPQPLPLIRFYKKRQPWVWRCHVDLTSPNPDLWEYLKGFILRYDHLVVSDERYKKSDLPVDSSVIHPVIDPLSAKNRDIPQSLISQTLRKHGVPTDKPLILQVSRFDRWKDPIGVIEVYKRVKEHVDCRLVLCGSMAADDPEGLTIYHKVEQRANAHMKKGEIVFLTREDSILVNSLQRVSAVVLQMSTREGFGLTVTEALWKEKPVVATRVGGIPLQIVDGQTGYLVEPQDYDAAAERVVHLLKHPDLARQMGANAKEFVRRNFLVTRHLLDEIRLFNELLGCS